MAHAVWSYCHRGHSSIAMETLIASCFPDLTQSRPLKSGDMLQKTADLIGLVLLTVFSNSNADDHDTCLFKSRRVLSYDHHLLSPDNLIASSTDFSTPVHYLVSRSNSPARVWCTAPGAGTNHHINISFSLPVVVEHVISSGFSNGYVTNFSIDYSPEWEAEFTAYHSPQYFLVPHIDTVFALDKPLVANRVKLLIHSGVVAPSGRLCWHLTFLGCRLTDLPASTVALASSNAAMPTTFFPQPSSSPSVCPPDSQGHGVGDGVVIGSVMTATMLVLTLVMILLIYHAKYHSPHCTNQQDSTTADIQLVLYDNSQRCDVHPCEVPLTSPHARDDSLVDNPLYSYPYEHLQQHMYRRTEPRITMVQNESYQVTTVAGVVPTTPATGDSA